MPFPSSAFRLLIRKAAKNALPLVSGGEIKTAEHYAGPAVQPGVSMLLFGRTPATMYDREARGLVQLQRLREILGKAELGPDTSGEVQSLGVSLDRIDRTARAAIANRARGSVMRFMWKRAEAGQNQVFALEKIVSDATRYGKAGVPQGLTGREIEKMIQGIGQGIGAAGNMRKVAADAAADELLLPPTMQSIAESYQPIAQMVEKFTDAAIKPRLPELIRNVRNLQKSGVLPRALPGLGAAEGK